MNSCNCYQEYVTHKNECLQCSIYFHSKLLGPLENSIYWESAKQTAVVYLFFVAIEHMTNIVKPWIGNASNPYIENPYVFFIGLTFGYCCFIYKNSTP